MKTHKSIFTAALAAEFKVTKVLDICNYNDYNSIVMSMPSPKKIYLDYAASTPVSCEVFEAMRPFFSEKFGNPSSVHAFGTETNRALDISRETMAKLLNADFRDIVFTGSATEANNLAVAGACKFFASNHPGVKPHIIISEIEHESVLNAAENLKNKNLAELTVIPVNQNGFVNPENVKNALKKNTVIVSIMYTNNIIGSIQPIQEIAKIINDFRFQNSKFKFPYTAEPSGFRQNSKLKAAWPLFHTDAVQAFQYLDCDVQKLGIDFLTLSAHKIYGPKGIGLLYACKADSKFMLRNSKFPTKLVAPILLGGGQEFGLRSGTENIPAIVGFAKAAEIASKNRKKESEKVYSLKKRFCEKIKHEAPPAFLIPHSAAEKDGFLPNIISIGLPKEKSQNIVNRLDAAGVCVSSGAACSMKTPKTPRFLPSVLGNNAEKFNLLRFSFGRQTSVEEIDTAVKKIKNVIEKGL